MFVSIVIIIILILGGNYKGVSLDGIKEKVPGQDKKKVVTLPKSNPYFVLPEK